MLLHLNQLLAEGFHLSLKRFFPGVLFILHDERAACGLAAALGCKLDDLVEETEGKDGQP